MKATVSELSRHATELEIQNRAKQLEIDRLKKKQAISAAIGKAKHPKTSLASAIASASTVAAATSPPLPKAEISTAKQLSPEEAEKERIAQVRRFATDGSTFQSKLCRKRLGQMVLQNVTLKLGKTHLTVVAGSMLSYFFSNTEYDLKTIYKVQGDVKSFKVLFVDGTTECFSPRDPAAVDSKTAYQNLSSHDSTKLLEAVKEGVLTQVQVLDCARSALPVSVVLETQEADVMCLWRKFLLSRLLRLWDSDNVDVSLPNRVGLWEATHLLLEEEANQRAAARAATRDKAIEFGSKVIHKLLEVEEDKDRHALRLQISSVLPKVQGRVSASQWRKLEERLEAMRKDPHLFSVVQHKQLLAELEGLV